MYGAWGIGCVQTSSWEFCARILCTNCQRAPRGYIRIYYGTPNPNFEVGLKVKGEQPHTAHRTSQHVSASFVEPCSHGRNNRQCIYSPEKYSYIQYSTVRTPNFLTDKQPQPQQQHQQSDISSMQSHQNPSTLALSMPITYT
jgi:hypothetical protein